MKKAVSFCRAFQIINMLCNMKEEKGAIPNIRYIDIDDNEKYIYDYVMDYINNNHDESESLSMDIQAQYEKDIKTYYTYNEISDMLHIDFITRNSLDNKQKQFIVKYVSSDICTSIDMARCLYERILTENEMSLIYYLLENERDCYLIKNFIRMRDININEAYNVVYRGLTNIDKMVSKEKLIKLTYVICKVSLETRKSCHISEYLEVIKLQKTFEWLDYDYSIIYKALRKAGFNYMLVKTTCRHLDKSKQKALDFIDKIDIDTIIKK